MLTRKEFDAFKCDSCGKEKPSYDGSLPDERWFHFYHAVVGFDNKTIEMRNATFCNMGCLKQYISETNQEDTTITNMPDMKCRICGGNLTFMGNLGKKVYYRCRDCGQYDV